MKVHRENRTYQRIFCEAIVSLLFVSALFSSCVNDHCNENMYAPLNVAFYSEIDTSQQAGLAFLLVQGVGTDSITLATNLFNINLTLNANQPSSSFAMGFPLPEADFFIQDGENRFISLIDEQSYTLNGKINDDIYLFNNRLEDAKKFLSMGDDSIFIFQKIKFDTLKVTYDRTIEFVSAECGCMNTYTVKTAGFIHKRIGETIISNPLINSQNNEKHIRVYLENY